MNSGILPHSHKLGGIICPKKEESDDTHRDSGRAVLAAATLAFADSFVLTSGFAFQSFDVVLQLDHLWFSSNHHIMKGL